MNESYQLFYHLEYGAFGRGPLFRNFAIDPEVELPEGWYPVDPDVSHMNYDSRIHRVENYNNFVIDEENGIAKIQWIIHERPLDEIKTFVKKQITAERTKIIDSGFVYKDVHYQTTQYDRENIHGMTTSLILNQDVNTIHWITTNNQFNEFTRTEFFEFAQAAAARTQSEIFRARYTKNEIDAETTGAGVINKAEFHGYTIIPE
jgi:hypothetical protein